MGSPPPKIATIGSELPTEGGGGWRYAPSCSVGGLLHGGRGIGGLLLKTLTTVTLRAPPPVRIIIYDPNPLINHPVFFNWKGTTAVGHPVLEGSLLKEKKGGLLLPLELKERKEREG